MLLHESLDYMAAWDLRWSDSTDPARLAEARDAARQAYRDALTAIGRAERQSA